MHIHRYYVRDAYCETRGDDGYTTHYMHGRIAALDSRRRLATRATAAGGGVDDDDGDGRSSAAVVAAVGSPRPRSAVERIV